MISALSSRARWKRYFVFVAITSTLSGCAQHYTGATFSDPYGFFSGIWHGFVFPYAVIANLLSWFLHIFGVEFLSDIQIIGRPNSGIFFYYIGFFLGLSSYGGANASR